MWVYVCSDDDGVVGAETTRHQACLWIMDKLLQLYDEVEFIQQYNEYTLDEKIDCINDVDDDILVEFGRDHGLEIEPMPWCDKNKETLHEAKWQEIQRVYQIRQL